MMAAELTDDRHIGRAYKNPLALYCYYGNNIT